MSLSHSPKIVTDGLVMYYDEANTKKSWKGMPTTNLAETYQDVSVWGGSSVGDVTTNNTYHNGGLIYRLADADGVDPNISVDNYKMLHSAFTTLTEGDWYSFSLDLKVIQKSSVVNTGGSANGIWIWFGGSTTNLNFLDYDIDVWYRVNVVAQVGATYDYLTPRIDYDNSIIDIANVQFEFGDFATPFVNGTRTNTESILDLTGNNTITANALTYNSDNSFEFDGSTNYLTTPTPNIGLSPNNWTICGWIKPTTATSSFFLTPNSAGIDHCITYDGVSERLTLKFTEAGDVNNRSVLSPNNTVPLNITSYFAVSINGLNVKLNINDTNYVDITTDIPSIADWDGDWRIGQRGNSTYWFTGDLPIILVYDHELTNEEKTQNFNALRGRFGI